jgi:catechol 2,3-dioxygenase-like lactoylglutathione lyase family enzyme
MELGLTASDLKKSRAFYRKFVGLEELPPVQDPLLGTTRYSHESSAGHSPLTADSAQ